MAHSLASLQQFIQNNAYAHEPQLVLPFDEEIVNVPNAQEILIEDPQNAQGMEMDCTFCLSSSSTRLPVYETGARCGHYFHAACLQPWFDRGNGCPVCRRTYGDVVKIGSMPDGEMRWFIMSQELPGHTCDTIVLHFSFPPGYAQSEGTFYAGRQQRAYLPNNESGRKLLALFAIAFRRRLLFPLGNSFTIPGLYWPTFGSIHFKTTLRPTPAGGHGYPDQEYVTNVLEELRGQGVHQELADSAQGARLLEAAAQGPSCGYRFERILRHLWPFCLILAFTQLPLAVLVPILATFFALLRLPIRFQLFLLCMMLTILEHKHITKKKVTLSPSGYIVALAILYSSLAACLGRYWFFRSVSTYVRLFIQNWFLLSCTVLIPNVVWRIPLGTILAGFCTFVAVFSCARPRCRRRRAQASEGGGVASPLLAGRHDPLLG